MTLNPKPYTLYLIPSSVLMLTRIKKIIATDLVKVTSLNAVATLVRMLTGFISVKVVAVLIGPAGVALLGQLLSAVRPSPSIFFVRKLNILHLVQQVRGCGEYARANLAVATTQRTC